MARILVTGGAGYVGSVCCRQLLDQGHDVIVIDDLSTGHAEAVPAGAALHRLDYGDRGGVAQLLRRNPVDAVFHFAARALIPESVSNPGFFFEVNVGAGIAFLETLRDFGIRRFVFSSSAAVYGNPESARIDESDPADPVNAYGETKLMLERVLRWYASAYRWTVVVFRYFNACGATPDAGEDHRPETHIIPLLLQTAARERRYFEIYGDDYPTPDGTCVRDYVHVSDIAAAHLLALDGPADPGMRVFNIGCGRGYSVLEVVRAAEAVTGENIPVRRAARRAGDPAVLCASPARLMRELGWQPRYSHLPDIIRSAWEWKQKRPLAYSTTVAEMEKSA
ncbi:MAG TPA: UDP-glucose 4-epimerase GalE [Terriglobales bacterium]|nr:UDP-glucose 4-epimerase GalE [Terriglobales bacterium]